MTELSPELRKSMDRAVDVLLKAKYVVALTGDVVDEDNKFYEAFSALQAVCASSKQFPFFVVAQKPDLLFSLGEVLYPAKSVIIYEVQVDKSDMGKIIGKHGQTAGAIRTILNAASAKTKRHAILEILE